MAGRPKKVFTEEQKKSIEQMALDNCYTRTIAEALGESQDTIKRHFASLLQKKRAEGKVALRRQQRKLAVNNVAMAIFLGKNELDQTDKQERKHTLSTETAILLGLIDGGTKGKLPNKEESENAGQ